MIRDAAAACAWSAFWVGVLAFSVARGSWIGAAVASAFLSGTIGILVAVARHRKRRIADEVAKHDACHVRTAETMLELAKLQGFRLHESVARELEILADSLRGAPRHSALDPHRLADVLEERVAELRQAAPDPPAVDLGSRSLGKDDD